MSHKLTDYEAFEISSVSNRRLLRQEELILEVTEALSQALKQGGITKKDLADRLGKTKGFVSQLLAGGRNLTLRTIADIAEALDCRIRIQCENLRHREDETRVSLKAYCGVRHLWSLPVQPVILEAIAAKKTEPYKATPVSFLRAAA